MGFITVKLLFLCLGLPWVRIVLQMGRTYNILNTWRSACASWLGIADGRFHKKILDLLETAMGNRSSRTMDEVEATSLVWNLGRKTASALNVPLVDTALALCIGVGRKR